MILFFSFENDELDFWERGEGGSRFKLLFLINHSTTVLMSNFDTLILKKKSAKRKDWNARTTRGIYITQTELQTERGPQKLTVLPARTAERELPAWVVGRWNEVKRKNMEGDRA